jgi:hypothetical protein
VTTFHGRRVHLLQAPTQCRRSWLFRQVNRPYAGKTLIAYDRVPCVA